MVDGRLFLINVTIKMVWKCGGWPAFSHQREAELILGCCSDLDNRREYAKQWCKCTFWKVFIDYIGACDGDKPQLLLQRITAPGGIISLWTFYAAF